MWATQCHKPMINIYTIWLFNIAMENHHFEKINPGKPSINGQFSMAMLNNQRVYIYVYTHLQLEQLVEALLTLMIDVDRLY